MALKGRIAIGFERTLFKRFCLQDRVSGSGRLITLRIGSSTYACTTSNSQQPTAHRIFLKKNPTAHGTLRSARCIDRRTCRHVRTLSIYMIGNTYTTTVVQRDASVILKIDRGEPSRTMQVALVQLPNVHCVVRWFAS